MIKFKPTNLPAQEAVPDHLIVDQIQLMGLADPSGMVIQIRTVWADASGNILKSGPSKEILASQAAQLRNEAAWDAFITTILEELVSRGDINGVIL